MNLFQAVKSSITAREAAENYGLKVSRNGMCICPFHADKNPSFKVDARFHCFGCQADGDVIDFTARLFHLSAMEAAQKLAADFGIQYEAHRSLPLRAKPRGMREEERFERSISHCYRVLADYRNMLADWLTTYAPISADSEWHSRFAEVLGNMATTEYLLDTLRDGSRAEKEQIVNEQAYRLPVLEKRIQAFREQQHTSVLTALNQPCHSRKIKTMNNKEDVSL